MDVIFTTTTLMKTLDWSSVKLQYVIGCIGNLFVNSECVIKQRTTNLNI